MMKWINNTLRKPGLFEVAKICIGIAFFELLLLFPPPLSISRLFYLPDWRILVSLFLLFALLFSRKGKAWDTIQISLVFGLFAMPMIYKWQFATYDGFTIGGLLPWSDASSYYNEAYRLINGLLFTAWGGRRPLFESFLAAILRFSGGNYTSTLVILILANIIAVLIVLQVIKRRYGAVGAAVYIIMTFEFYSRFTGAVMTEQLGFMLGNIALFFLLVGIETRRFWYVLWGLGVLTLALNTRAGAFFILPILILWFAHYFRKQMSVWRIISLSIAVVISVFFLNILLARIITGQSGTTFTNYSYTLYGLASGNKGWWQVMQDYPGVTEAEIMPLAIQKVREDPGMFIHGIQEAYKDYFKPYGGGFSFLRLGKAQQFANILLWGLVLIGLIHSYFNLKTRTGGLVLISFVGVIACAGLVPPIDADSMRAYAATIPFTALWVAAGLSVISTYGRKLFPCKEPEEIDKIDIHNRIFALGFSILIILLAISSLLLVKIFPYKDSDSVVFSTQSICGIDQEQIQGIEFKDTSVFLIEDDMARESYIPFIRISDFRNAIGNGSYPFLEEALLHLEAGDRITAGLRWDETKKHASGIWIISKLPAADGEFNLCGKATQDEKLKNYAFYYVNGKNTQRTVLTYSQRKPTRTLAVRLLYGLGLGFVIFLLIMDVLGLKRISLSGVLFTLVTLFLVLQSGVMFFYTHGILSVPSYTQKLSLQEENSIPAQGNLYFLPLGTTWMNQAELVSSPAVVYENGAPLEFPNSMHKDIRETGKGRYSIWNGYLYFSSSDNSDPRTNGRVYEIEWPTPIPPILQWISYLAGFFGLALWSAIYIKIHGLLNTNSKETPVKTITQDLPENHL
jgi:hypothetical protein